MAQKKTLIYLDHAAATPIDRQVELAMRPFYRDLFYNPSAVYQKATQAKQALETARSRVAGIIGAKSSEIIFTAGGTEANNLAIKGVMDAYPGAKLIVSAVEHESVLRASENYDRTLCPVDSGGVIDLLALKTLIKDDTVLVSLMYANNEIGTIEPLNQAAKLIAGIKTDRLKRGIKLPLYLHSDACQAANYLDLHVSRLGVDLMTLNAGKIYGPKQSGALFIKAGVKLKPLIEGGGQEHGLRSGTESVAMATGLAEALEATQKIRKDETKRLENLRDHFNNELSRIYQEAVINGDPRHKLANNIHFSLPGQDNERILYKLDQAGIMAAAGSACSASNDLASHVLAAVGLDDKMAQSSIRMTLGRSSKLSDVNYTLQVLKDIV